MVYGQVINIMSTRYKIACDFLKKQMLLVYTCLPVADQITLAYFNFWSVC